MATPKSPWPIRINVVDLEAWKPYGEDGRLSEWANDNAYDDWKHYHRDHLDDYIGDILKAAKVRQKVTSEEMDRITDLLKEDPNELETVFHAITGASTWAWEEAYTPADQDIERSIRLAMEHLYEYADLDGEWVNFLGTPIKNRGPEDWDPREKKYSEAQLLEELEKGVRYEREPNYYDRFIVIDWSGGPIVKYLEQKLEGLEDPSQLGDTSELGHFHWNLKDIADSFRKAFEKQLAKAMEDRDVSNRVNFQKYWKQMLSDKGQMKHAAAEIEEFLGR